MTTGYANAALHQCLPTAGLGLRRHNVDGHIVATLRFPYWPTHFRWW